MGNSSLLRAQKKIYNDLAKSVSLLMGATPPEILKYEAESKSDFKVTKTLEVAQADLIEEMRSRDLTLLADFHTYSQAQRMAIRLLREAVRPDERWVIGLELVATPDQDKLNSYCKDKISLEELKESIQYDKTWGFPWENYSALFEWAKANHIEIVALNLPGGISTQQRDLPARDRWAAGVITDLYEQDPQLKMLVLYGEYHIASRHLPSSISEVSFKHLGRRLDTLIVHQNNDSLFWKLAHKGSAHRTNVLKLKERIYCVFSGTPWGKMQSLLDWLETDRTCNEDALSLIKSFGDTLAEVLRIEPASFDSLNIIPLEQRSRFKPLLDENKPFYLQPSQAAYLGRSTLNDLAEVAALHLFHQRSHQTLTNKSKSNNFFEFTLQSAFGFFGSLVLNPRRKTDLIADHQKIIDQNIIGESKARALTLVFLASPGDFIFPSRISPNTLAKAARYSGEIIGKKLYQAFHDQIATQQDIWSWFFEKAPEPKFILADIHRKLQNSVQLNSSKNQVF